MDLRCLVSIFVALFYGGSSTAYLVLDQLGGSVLMLDYAGRVYYQPCATDTTTNLPPSPDLALKQCAGSTKQDSFSLPAGEYVSSLAALYGVPTAALPAEPGASLFSSFALKAEQSFRNPTKAPSISDESFQRLSTAYDEILQYLGPEASQRLSDKDPEHFSRRVAAVQALHPFFSDGRIVLHLGQGELQSDNADCRAQMALADWRSLVEIFSRPATNEALLAWLAPRMKTSGTSPTLGTWLPHYRPTKARNGSVGYTFGTAHLELVLSPSTLAWIQTNKLAVEAADRRSPLENTPGYGSVITPVDGKRSYPVLCFSRVARLPSELERVSPGLLSTAELAARYGLTQARFERWALNDPTTERLLAPTVILGIKIGEDYFTRLLREPLDRLMGRDLPRFEEVEQAAVEAEKKAAAEQARLRQQKEEALAAERREQQRLIAEFQQEGIQHQAAFDRAKREKSDRVGIHLCANSARPLQVWMAVLGALGDNFSGWTTFGVWNVPAWGCIPAYNGRPMQAYAIYSDAVLDDPEPPEGALDLVIQTVQSPAVAVRAHRTILAPGERRAIFSPFPGGNGTAFLMDRTGLPQEQIGIQAHGKGHRIVRVVK